MLEGPLTAAGAQDQADQDARDHALSLGASTRRAKSSISTRAFADVQTRKIPARAGLVLGSASKVPNRSSGHAFEYCGLINAKSGRTGGYSGMKPFLATIRTESGNIIGGAIAALSSDNLEENRDVIPKLCQRKGLNPFEAK